MNQPNAYLFQAIHEIVFPIFQSHEMLILYNVHIVRSATARKGDRLVGEGPQVLMIDFGRCTDAGIFV